MFAMGFFGKVLLFSYQSKPFKCVYRLPVFDNLFKDQIFIFSNMHFLKLCPDIFLGFSLIDHLSAVQSLDMLYLQGVPFGKKGGKNIFFEGRCDESMLLFLSSPCLV